MTIVRLIGASLILGALAAGSVHAMTQAELNAECTRIWGPPDHHYTPNGCVKGKLVIPKGQANRQVTIKAPLTKPPGGGTPVRISDQAAAGNLSSSRK